MRRKRIVLRGDVKESDGLTRDPLFEFVGFAEKPEGFLRVREARSCSVLW